MALSGRSLRRSRLVNGPESGTGPSSICLGGLSPEDPRCRSARSGRVVPGHWSVNRVRRPCYSREDKRIVIPPLSGVPGGGWWAKGTTPPGQRETGRRALRRRRRVPSGTPRSRMGRHLGEPVGAIDQDAARSGLLPRALRSRHPGQRRHQPGPRPGPRARPVGRRIPLPGLLSGEDPQPGGGDRGEEGCPVVGDLSDPRTATTSVHLPRER